MAGELPDHEVVTIVKDMGVTHADCRRILPQVAPEVPLRWRGHTAFARWPDRQVEIELGPEQCRRIASLTLPRTLVTLRFTGFSEATRKAWLSQFDRRFQRGGG